MLSKIFDVADCGISNENDKNEIIEMLLGSQIQSFPGAKPIVAKTKATMWTHLALLIHMDKSKRKPKIIPSVAKSLNYTQIIDPDSQRLVWLNKNDLKRGKGSVSVWRI